MLHFGDADNDYDMTLKCWYWCRLWLMVVKKTKSVANYITNDNDHDGIGNYIEKYIL